MPNFNGHGDDIHVSHMDAWEMRSTEFKSSVWFWITDLHLVASSNS